MGEEAANLKIKAYIEKKRSSVFMKFSPWEADKVFPTVLVEGKC